MTSSTIRDELENDLEWRMKEIRNISNMLLSDTSTPEIEMRRRPVVLLLYAHLEGFCRFALSAYARTINSMGLRCEEVDHAIAAASLADVFKALRHPASKCATFRNSLPNDADLHKFARDREFVTRSKEVWERPVSVDDSLFEPGQNMTPVLLQRCLYRMGLPHDALAPFTGSLHLLLQWRNPIAHGESRNGVPERTFEQIRTAADKVMAEIARLITDAVFQEAFRGPKSASVQRDAS